MLKSFMYATWVLATLGALVAITLANLAVPTVDGEMSIGGRLFCRLILSVWVAAPYGLWALLGWAAWQQRHAGLAITTYINGLLASGLIIFMSIFLTFSEPSESAIILALAIPLNHAGALVAVPRFVFFLVLLEEMENPK